MRRGERNLLLGMAIVVITVMVFTGIKQSKVPKEEINIPFYTIASKAVQHNGGMLYKRLGCKRCHSLWTNRDMMRSVPSPALDGMGSLRDRDWLYAYFSTDNPQSIIPSRLKKEYQMPSLSHLSEDDRLLLTEYISSLKVKDWYLDELKASECRKLTGEVCAIAPY